MSLRKEIEEAINRHSRENTSNTPDFILARYLTDCLEAFENASNARTVWYGGEIGPVKGAHNFRGGHDAKI